MMWKTTSTSFKHVYYCVYLIKMILYMDNVDDSNEFNQWLYLNSQDPNIYG